MEAPVRRGKRQLPLLLVWKLVLGSWGFQPQAVARGILPPEIFPSRQAGDELELDNYILDSLFQTEPRASIPRPLRKARMREAHPSQSAHQRNAKAQPKCGPSGFPWHPAFAPLCQAAYGEAALPAPSYLPI